MKALFRFVLGLPLAAAVSGCVYLNGLYNAQEAYGDAERARLAGQDSLAQVGYARAAAGAERSYQRDPEGDWADDALYLLGRARLRREDWDGARDALERARDGATNSDVRLASTMYLGALALATGDSLGIGALDFALVGLGRGAVRGEGHLWRARYLLARGRVSEGWADLERARLEDPSLRVPAALEWLTSGVVDGDPLRAREGANALLRESSAAERADTIVALAAREGDLRGPAAGARLLAGADSAAWTSSVRDRLILIRAKLHLVAGDSASARRDGARVADAGGERSIEARLWLARIALDGMDRADQLDQLRPLLLPAVEDPTVRALLEGARQLELLAERGRQANPLGLFAAAEIARDVLAAPRLAEALFVDYAAATPPQPWQGKALLAAAAVAADPERSALLRRAASALPGDPYVAVTMGIAGDPQSYEILERALRDELLVLLADVTAVVRPNEAMIAGDSLTELPR